MSTQHAKTQAANMASRDVEGYALTPRSRKSTRTRTPPSRDDIEGYGVQQHAGQTGFPVSASGRAGGSQSSPVCLDSSLASAMSPETEMQGPGGSVKSARAEDLFFEEDEEGDGDDGDVEESASSRGGSAAGDAFAGPAEL